LAIKGIAAMREGFDGSGVGLLLRDIGGPLQRMKDSPILSGIFTRSALKKLDRFMMENGFLTKYKVTFKLPQKPPPGTPKRDVYLIRAYEYPQDWEDLEQQEIQDRMMMIRLTLKKMGEANKDLYVFSFWPDTIIIKEIGNPIEVAEYLGLDRKDLEARLIFVQGRQNTNYNIDLYACHPFFLQGFASMTNGENTAFLPNREFLVSRGFPGYNGYMSDSEIFTHTLHYVVSKLGLEVEHYKHIITPLLDEDLHAHPNGALLKSIKQSCRSLIIDGPNCVIGCLPDKTLFMVQDRKKLRPGIVGHNNGLFVMSSETCGIDAILPDRDIRQDFQPMHMDTVCVDPERNGLAVYRQTDPLPFFN
jgi:glutamate synthase domain-containing protein 1